MCVLIYIIYLFENSPSNTLGDKRFLLVFLKNRTFCVFMISTFHTLHSKIIFVNVIILSHIKIKTNSNPRVSGTNNIFRTTRTSRSQTAEVRLWFLYIVRQNHECNVVERSASKRLTQTTFIFRSHFLYFSLSYFITHYIYSKYYIYLFLLLIDFVL